MAKTNTTPPPPAPVASPPAPKERLFEVEAEEYFSDGNLGEFMKRYGYPIEWPRGEARKLPEWLIKRVQQSGGVLTLTD